VPIVTTRCVVLQTYRYSDTSKILRLMTREHGPRSAIARGALRPKSRISGVLEPFAEGDATLYLKAGRDLHALSDFELLRERQSLGTDLRRFAGASVLCELVLRLAPEHPDPGLYRALVAGLNALVDAPAAEVVGTAVSRIWALVSVLGFAPTLDACVVCGRPIARGAGARFDHREGGLRCLHCPPAGTTLDPAATEELRLLVSGAAPDDVSGRQAGLLRDFVRYHAAEGYQIRSLDFLGELRAP
jgi:DNA repair protein RecO (recombination protein O)